MSDFRKRLLGLTVMAMAFAGLSYGQGALVSCSSVAPTPGPLNLRAEGVAELVGDFQFTCTSTGAISGGTVESFLSAPVTSKLNADNSSSGTQFTEAALFICAGTAVCPTTGTPVYGTVAGNAITFSSVGFPSGSFTGRISNVRINASAVTISSTITSVTEQVLASATGTSAATSPATTVGFVFKGLATPTLATHANGTTGPSVLSYTTCIGNPLPSSGNLSTASFQINVTENFGGAFKTLGGTGANTEAGSFVSGDAKKAGAAVSGTRIGLTFASVSTGMTIYLPQSVTNGPFTLTLTTSEGGPFTATTAATTSGAPVSSVAYTAVSGGTATVYYEVTATDSNTVETAAIPVYITFAANAFTSSQGPVTVLEFLAPLAADVPGNIPSFAATTNTAISTSTVTPCITSLLFPYVVNGLGFDTGIVLANTSTDPFTPKSTASATPAPGSCTLNFYGTGAPTPSTGVAAPGGTQASGTVSAFLLSSVAPGFQGYMIAVCNYQYGHGLAFLAYNLGQNNGATTTYIPLELNGNARPGSLLGSPGIESLGQ